MEKESNSIFNTTVRKVVIFPTNDSCIFLNPFNTM